MKENKFKVPIPKKEEETLRTQILKYLSEGSHSLREISQFVRISEKEVYGHLEHLKKSHKENFIIYPAKCLKCGFNFIKRNKIKKPGRCPVCKNEHIKEPLYEIKK